MKYINFKTHLTFPDRSKTVRLRSLFNIDFELSTMIKRCAALLADPAMKDANPGGQPNSVINSPSAPLDEINSILISEAIPINAHGTNKCSEVILFIYVSIKT